MLERQDGLERSGSASRRNAEDGINAAASLGDPIEGSLPSTERALVSEGPHCDQVLDIIRKIDQGSLSVRSGDLIELLESQGFIDIITESTYRLNLFDALQNPEVEKRTRDLGNSAEKLEFAMRELTEDLGSFWHKLTSFSWLGSGKLKRERAALAALQQVSNYQHTPHGYIALTENGHELKRNLAAAGKRTQDTPFEKFQREQEQIKHAIEERIVRYADVRGRLDQLGFDSEKTEVIDYAFGLSLQQGEATEVVNRAGVINTYMYNQKWESYRRLAVASSVAAKDGDIEDLREDLRRIAVEMFDRGHVKEYSTWLEAAAIIDIPGDEVAERVDRFDRIRGELAKVGWGKGMASTCFIAAKLGAMEGSPSELAQTHNRIERMLISQGRTDSAESGIAALILMNGEGSLDERVDRFGQAFSTLVTEGWEKSTENYGTAAMVSMLAGSVEENVILLDRTKEVLKERGLNSHLDARALMMVSAAYADLTKGEEMPSFLSVSNFSAERAAAIAQANAEAAAAQANMMTMLTVLSTINTINTMNMVNMNSSFNSPST